MAEDVEESAVKNYLELINKIEVSVASKSNAANKIEVSVASKSKYTNKDEKFDFIEQKKPELLRQFNRAYRAAIRNSVAYN